MSVVNSYMHIIEIIWLVISEVGLGNQLMVYRCKSMTMLFLQKYLTLQMLNGLGLLYFLLLFLSKPAFHMQVVF